MRVMSLVLLGQAMLNGAATCSGCNAPSYNEFTIGNCTFTNTMQICDDGVLSSSSYLCITVNGSEFSFDGGGSSECSPWAQ